MLTLLDSLSLAGDRARQNDDAGGAAPPWAWVVDGATDLHDRPIGDAASDAAWIGAGLSEMLTRLANACADPRTMAAQAAAALAGRFALFDRAGEAETQRWMRPIASVLLVRETPRGVTGLDLGDCRAAWLDAEGAAAMVGGPAGAADHEREKARAAAAGGSGPLLARADVLAALRRDREAEVSHVFSLDPACAQKARTWEAALARPAHIVLMTDGFSALIDRYGAYDAAGLVEAARADGLARLAQELRAIENADEAGESHPRFKKSDDATALLLRLS